MTNSEPDLITGCLSRPGIKSESYPMASKTSGEMPGVISAVTADKGA